MAPATADYAHPFTDGLSSSLSALTGLAVDRALDCLSGLEGRETEADQDRGARSAECLMRVASAAVGLRAKLQKEAEDAALAAENHLDGNQSAAERAIERDAERLAARLDAELKRAQDALTEGNCS